MGNQPAASKRYPPELKERAVRMVRELRLSDPKDQGVVTRVARQLGQRSHGRQDRVGKSLISSLTFLDSHGTH